MPGRFKFAAYPRFEAHDADQARAELRRTMRNFRQRIDDTRYFLRTHTAGLDPISVTHMVCPTPRETWAEADDRNYILLRYLHGSSEVSALGGKFRICPGEGILTPPDLESRHKVSPGQELLVACIPARALLEHHPAHSIRSLSLIPKQAPVWRILDQIVAELERPDGLFTKSPGAAPYIQQALIAAAIQPPPGDSNIAFWHVRRCARALDFMDQHLSDALRVADIAGALGVSARALEQSFEIHGYPSPMRMFRAKRLDAAHNFLLHPGDQITVEAAREMYGFSNGGDFAEEYRERFGEYPHETLKKASERSGS